MNPAHSAEHDAISHAEISAMTIDQLFANAEALQRSGQSSQAIKLYQDWLANNEGNNKHAVLFNLGCVLQNQQLLDQAETAYRTAISIFPKFPQAIINLGLLLEKKNLPEQAIEQWTSIVAYSLQKDPISVEFQVIALNHIGRLQEAQRNYDLAEYALKKSLMLEPNQAGVIQHWVHIRQKSCKWPVFEEIPGITLNKQLMCTSPLAMLALHDDPVIQLLSSNAFVARSYNTKEEYLCKSKRYRHKRIRIGYLSGDLCMHAVGLLLGPFFEAHDKSKFEIYAYDYSPEDGSDLRARLKNSFDYFKNVKNMTDRETAQMICQDEIEILIDMHGLSNGARPGITALHPAPHQGTYLGFIGTTAFPWIDFVITDRFSLPEENLVFFTEKPLYVEGSFIPLMHEPMPDNTFTRHEFGIPEDAFVMASFGNIYKINEKLFETWINILKKTENTVLWLLDDNDIATNNLRNEARSHGVDLNRIIFTKRASYGEYKTRLLLADIYLDTYPYNCGSTARDVIETGLPLITISGKTMVSRMAGSILNKLGLDHLICANYAEYETKIVNLISDRTTLNMIKEKVKSSRTAINSNSIETLVKSLENQYLRIIN